MFEFLMKFIQKKNKDILNKKTSIEIDYNKPAQTIL